LFVLQPHHVATETLEQKLLKIEHAVAVITGRRPNQPQSLGMPVEEIRVLAQIGKDVAGADLGRLRRQRAAVAGRLWLVLRTVSHV
jgi:hypothetical protein